MKTRAFHSVSREACCPAVVFVALSSVPVMNAATPKLPTGDPERGQALFNGRAIWSTCHGIDEDQSRRPLITPNAERAIAGLRPTPAKLRDASTLKLKTDQERFEVIRNGHLNSRMDPLPEQVLSDQDIEDLLAYLAVLRGQTVR